MKSNVLTLVLSIAMENMGAEKLSNCDT